jgi:hypothetical protein
LLLLGGGGGSVSQCVFNICIKGGGHLLAVLFSVVLGPLEGDLWGGWGRWHPRRSPQQHIVAAKRGRWQGCKVSIMSTSHLVWCVCVSEPTETSLFLSLSFRRQSEVKACCCDYPLPIAHQHSRAPGCAAQAWPFTVISAAECRAREMLVEAGVGASCHAIRLCRFLKRW